MRGKLSFGRNCFYLFIYLFVCFFFMVIFFSLALKKKGCCLSEAHFSMLCTVYLCSSAIVDNH